MGRTILEDRPGLGLADTVEPLYQVGLIDRIDIDLLPGDTVVAGVVAASGFLATATGAAEAENGRQANRMRSRADLIRCMGALLQR